MKARISVAPAKFEKAVDTGAMFDSMQIVYPHDPLFVGEEDFKNAAEVKEYLEVLAERIDESAFVFIRPKSRKFGGFDKFENENRALFELNA